MSSTLPGETMAMSAFAFSAGKGYSHGKRMAAGLKPVIWLSLWSVVM